MNLEILLSCMHQKDFSLIEKSNITVPTLLVNQCDEEGLIEKYPHRLLNTKTRGLMVSRNIALKYAKGEVLLLADDDQQFDVDLEKKIIDSYKENPDADMIIFQYSILEKNSLRKKTGVRVKKTRLLKRLECLRVSSVQISFKRDSVCGKIKFDSKLTIGEDTKFVLDAYDAGLKIYVSPIEITKVSYGSSTHFFGYDKDYFYKRGQRTRYFLGLPLATLYAFYFIVVKYNLYKKTCNPFVALKSMFEGFYNPIK